MDRIQRLPYPMPLAPLGPSETSHKAPQRFKGKVVGVRPGRSGEVGTTQILTIKLSDLPPEAARLLHAEVELLIRTK